VLVADDDPLIQRLVRTQLDRAGFRVLTAGDGETAVDAAAAEQPDLIVLDLMLPGIDGFEVCKRIREISQVPILMLTVRDSAHDKVLALDIGADDYLTKPFDHTELLARMRALVRRSTGPLMVQSDMDLHLGELTINFATHEVRMRGKDVQLTSTEYRLLEELIRSAGTAISHRTLLKKVWGPEYAGEVHYLKIFVRRLRQKLGDDGDRPRYILTDWGIGYRFASPQDARGPAQALMKRAV
jgi:DNA-binding response OmpR family regulator